MPQPATDAPQKSRVISAAPVYYGWVVLVAASLGLALTMPGQTVVVSVFLDPIIADLGAARTRVTLMYTLATLAGSFALPFVGRFVDRRGPRLSVGIIASLFALACAYMGTVRNLIMLFVGFMLIRSLGQGALSLVSQHVVNLWFVRRRGLAIGLAGLGFAIGTSFFPLLTESLIARFEWRLAYVLLGALVAATILPLGLWLYRGHPERFGLEPDGRATPTRPRLDEVNFTLAQARATPTFWLFVAGGVSFAAFGTGLLFHNYAILAESGLGREPATRVFVPIGLVSAGSNLLAGMLLDRVPPRFVLSFALLLLALALVLATPLLAPGAVLLYGSVLGLMQGSNAAIMATVFAAYFGRRHLGAIKGSVTTVTVAGTAFGPVLFSLGYDIAGSYTPVLLLTALVPLSLALVAPFVRPRHKAPD